MTGSKFEHNSVHPHSSMDPVILSQLPYLDDWNMSSYDPYVSDFIWSMDDSGHVESISKGLSEDQVDQLQPFADTNELGYQHWRRSSAAASSAGPAPSVADLTGRDKFREHEIKWQRQGLQTNEMSSLEQLSH